MATTIQNIELPKKPRARDTSSSSQDISQELLRNADFSANEAEDQTYLNGGVQFDDWVEQQSSGVRAYTTVTGGIRCTAETVTTTTWHQRIYQNLDASQQVVGKMYKAKATVLCSRATEFRFNVQESNSTDDQWSPENYDVDAGVERTIEVVYTCTDATNQVIVFFPLVVLTAGQYYEVKNVSLKEVESFPNNNHGKIYSGRALEFDGVTDYFQHNGGVALAGVNQFADGVPWTFACWMYLEKSDDNYFVGNDGTSHPHLIFDDDQFKFRDATANKDYYSFSLATTEKNTWHRVVITTDGDSVILYINGVVYGTITSSTEEDGAGTNLFTSTAMEFSGWGTPYASSGSRVLGFKGMMSDGQVWDATWSADDAAYDYLNPESLALNASGTALTEGNLKIWYPMQDGHRGQQSYILDGANTGLGVEKITNGDFATDSDWTKGTDWSIEEDKATYTPSGFSNLLQVPGLEVGKTYKLTVTVIGTGVDICRFYFGSSSDTAYILQNGENTIIGVAEADKITFRNLQQSAFSITNISVKAINDKHHATTVFFGDEMVNNVDFETSDLSDFTTTSGGTIEVEGGLLKLTDTSSTYCYTSAPFTTVVGRSYTLSIEIVDNSNTANANFIRIGTSHNNTSLHDVNYGVSYGVKTITVVAISTSTYITLITGAGVGEIGHWDNMSFKEVGVASGWTDADQQLHIPQTALQSYNELAWFDGYNDLVSVSDDNSLDVTSITISAWVNTAVTGAEKVAVGKYYSTAFEFGINSAAKPHVNCKINGVYNSHMHNTGTALAVNTWNHVVWTYDRSSNSSKTYLNGVLNETITPAVGGGEGLSSNTEPLYIGGRSTTELQWNGSITEVGVWSSAITSDEVQAIFNDGKALDVSSDSGSYASSGDLVSYWRNNGLSTWTDLKGSNNGTPTNITETILIPEGVDSTRDNQGFIMNRQRNTSSFNSTAGGGYVEIPVGAVDDDLAFLGVGDGFSIEVWIKVNGDSNGALILSRNNNTDGYRLEYNSSDKIAFGIEENNNISSAVTDSAISPNTWYHIVGTFDGDPDNNGSGEMKLYLNGETGGSVTNNNTSADMDTSISPMRIGKHYWEGAKIFDGEIDGVLIYNKVLSLEEVQKNYNATKRDHD